MKKILGLLSTMSLTSIGTTTVIACVQSDLGDIRYFNKNEVREMISEAVQTNGEEIELDIREYKKIVDPILNEFANINFSNKVKDVSIKRIYYSYFDEGDFRNDKRFLLESKQKYNFSKFNYALELEFDEYDPGDREWEFEDEGISIYNVYFDIDQKVESGISITRLRDEIEFERNDTIEDIYNEILEEYSERLIFEHGDELRSTKSLEGISGLFILDDFDITIKNNGNDVASIKDLKRKKTQYDVTIKSKEVSHLKLDIAEFSIYIERDWDWD